MCKYIRKTAYNKGVIRTEDCLVTSHSTMLTVVRFYPTQLYWYSGLPDLLFAKGQNLVHKRAKKEPNSKTRVKKGANHFTKFSTPTLRLLYSVHQRWADCEIFQSESSPDPIKLNPIQSWSAKFLKIISPIQSWSANVKSCIFIFPHEAKKILELFYLSPIMIGWRQNTSSSAFASWGKIDTAFWHFQNLTRKCLLGIRGKSTAGVISPLGESNCLDWPSDKDYILGLA